MCSSVAFDKCMKQDSHHHNRDMEHLHQPKMFPSAFCNLLPASTSRPLTTTYLLSITIALPFQNFI